MKRLARIRALETHAFKIMIASNVIRIRNILHELGSIFEYRSTITLVGIDDLYLSVAFIREKFDRYYTGDRLYLMNKIAVFHRFPFVK